MKKSMRNKVLTIITIMLLCSMFFSCTSENDILYPLKISEAYGFIDSRGQLIIKPEFEDAQISRCGIAIAELDGTNFYFDIKGTLLFTLKKQEKKTRSFSDDLLAVGAHVNDTFLYGFLDKKGEWVISPQYKKVSDFSEGYANVTDIHEDSYYITKNNMRAFEENFKGNQFKNGYASVERQVLENFYVEAVRETGIRYRRKVSGVFRGIINTEGQLIVPYTLSYSSDYSDGLFLVRYKQVDTKIGVEYSNYVYIDNTNMVQLETDFDIAYQFIDGAAVIKTEKNTYGIINREGNFVVEPTYALISSQSNGLFLFSKDMDKFGFMDDTGKIQIEAKLSFAQSFDGHLAYIEYNDSPGYINPEGVMFLASSYE